MVAFSCPGCRRLLNVKDEWAGRSCQCPHCGHISPVPSRNAAKVAPVPPAALPVLPLKPMPPAALPVAPASPIPPAALPVSPGGRMPPAALPVAPVLPDETVAAHAFHEATPAVTPSPTSTMTPLSAAAPKVPGYDILGELGRGGMGVVYKARQVGLKRIVALKMILAGAHATEHEMSRFRAEATAAASLQHPNIVQIYDIGEQEGRPYFSLEFVDGGGLDKKLAGMPQSPEQAAELVETLARAMAVAHQHGIVHRDLKPANILLAVVSGPLPVASENDNPFSSLTTDNWQLATVPKITDFGLAKKLEEDAMLTKSGAVMGTPSYMAPEQALGEASAVGPAADVYALGAILYEMLTGRPPFRGQTPMDTMFQVVTEDPVPPTRLLPKLPRDLETICLKCLQKERGKRYAGALELADDLRRFRNGEPIQARPVSAWEHAFIWAKRRPAAAALVAVSLAASCLLLAIWVVSYVRIAREQRQTAEALAREVHAKDELLKALVQNARLTSEALTEFNALYASEVVERVRKHGIEITHDYAGKTAAIPLPATMSVELGKRIGQRELGLQVRLYSDYPFPWRSSEGGPKDDFERAALRVLRQHPEQTAYYRFENWQGKPALRYVTPSRMKASCVNCHNSHPSSPKKNWKEGDIRGAFEVIFPVDPVVAGLK